MSSAAGRRSGLRRATRVYFVGAGLSAAMGYPVGRELIGDLIRYLLNEPPRDRIAALGFRSSLRSDPGGRKRAHRVLRAVEDVMAQYFARPLARADEVDVAEFFSVVHTLAESAWLARSPADGRWWGAPGRESLYADLAATVRSFFHDVGRARKQALPADVRSLIGRLRPGSDVVVSFNWDEELDVAIETTSSAGLDYTRQAALACGSVALLKPHGSVGWYDVTQGIGNGAAYFIAEDDDRVERKHRRMVSYWEAVLPVDIDGKTKHPVLGCPPLITPPTFAKRFDYREQRCIWWDVMATCSEATEFVFLGYSLPRDDFLTRAAIRSALRENRRRRGRRLRCLVVDRSYDDAKRVNYESVFGDGLRRDDHFLEWTFGQREPAFIDRLDAAVDGARLPR